MDRMDSIAIVGASAAGVGAAVAMRQAGFGGRITMFDRDPELPYERPPLSKSLAQPGQALKPLRPAESYSDLDIELCLGVSIDSLDPSNCSVTDSDGLAHRYDRVLIATGVSPRPLEIPGADLQHVLCLRTANDARRITARLAAGGPLVVIGGGFIGLELAAVARSVGMDVTVVELGALPLVGVVGPDIARLLTALHASHGVTVLTNTSVAEIRGHRAVEEVVLEDGRVLPAATVVVGVGVVPNDHVTRVLGIGSAQGIPVNSYGQTSSPWIWAAGDVAVRRHKYLRSPGRIEHWDTAQRHGDAVGRSIVGQLTEECAVPYVWSDQYELAYQSFGRIEPSDRLVLREGAMPNHFLAFFLDDTRVCAVAGVGHPREVRAGRSLIASKTPVAEDYLRNPGADIRKLVRPG